jgi:hypothetical protein
VVVQRKRGRYTVDPGLVATNNLSGNKEALKQRGARSSEASAQTIIGGGGTDP